MPGQVEHFADREPLAGIRKTSHALSDLMDERKEYRLQREVGPARIHRRRPDDHTANAVAAHDHRRSTVIELCEDTRITRRLQRSIAENSGRSEVATTRRAENVENRVRVVECADL